MQCSNIFNTGGGHPSTTSLPKECTDPDLNQTYPKPNNGVINSEHIQAFYQLPNIYKAVLVGFAHLVSSVQHFFCHTCTVSGPNRTLVVLLHYKLTSSGSVSALTYSRSHPPAACLYTGDPRHLLAHCIKHLSFCCLAYFLLRCSRPRSRRSSSSRALRRTQENRGGVILWLSQFFYNY